MSRRRDRRRVRACIGCGGCCGHYLPLTDAEIERICAYADEHGIRPRWTGIDCPWLADNKTCAIYEARPSICAAYHCRRSKAEPIAGDPADYHVYNTERLFVLGDRTHCDALAELAGGLGMTSFWSLFDADER